MQLPCLILLAHLFAVLPAVTPSGQLDALLPKNVPLGKANPVLSIS
jgi:hypothetical protein